MEGDLHRSSGMVPCYHDPDKAQKKTKVDLKKIATKKLPSKKGKAPPVQPKAVIDYLNHRNSQRPRTILPLLVRWGSTEWHPEPGWILEAYDFEKHAQRSFACKNIIKWKDLPE
jgi:hypothetical protein